jgi:hypothetical protein
MLFIKNGKVPLLLHVNSQNFHQSDLSHKKSFRENYCHTATAYLNLLIISRIRGGGRWVGGGSKLPNHGDFFKKSRQLLQEITALSFGNHGNFCNFSR